MNLLHATQLQKLRKLFKTPDVIAERPIFFLATTFGDKANIKLPFGHVVSQDCVLIVHLLFLLSSCVISLSMREIEPCPTNLLFKL
jgi:hypothetical protein